MTSRTAPLALTGLSLAIAISACAPTPVQENPSPTFSSKAEAFAAAEATYREYVKALNAVDLSDPETFEAVYAWTTGDANSEARRRFSQMHADGWFVEGDSVPTLIELASASETSVDLAVCVDVSRVELVDAQGTSKVSRERPDVQRMLVTLVPNKASGTQLVIADFAGREGEPTCD